MMRHLQRKKVSANSQVVTTVLPRVQARPALAKRRGACVWGHQVSSQSLEALRVPPCHRGSFLGGRSMSASRVEGRRKNRAFNAHVSWFRSGPSHVACFSHELALDFLSTIALPLTAPHQLCCQRFVRHVTTTIATFCSLCRCMRHVSVLQRQWSFFITRSTAQIGPSRVLADQKNFIRTLHLSYYHFFLRKTSGS